MNQLITHRMADTPSTRDWMRDRLSEARGILVDAIRHPDSLVVLAARAVAGQTVGASECADALDLLSRLDRRPLYAVAAAAFPNGGAA